MGMHIERVAASLNAMDSDQVSEPTLPISRALLEAAELAGLVQKEAVRSKLTNVGLELVTMTACPWPSRRCVRPRRSGPSLAMQASRTCRRIAKTRAKRCGSGCYVRVASTCAGT
jgi:hypothetical protein